MSSHDVARELKPCPFCGGEAEHRCIVNPACWVECSACGAVGPNDAETTEQNVAAWNTRPHPDNPARDEALKAVVAIVNDIEPARRKWINREQLLAAIRSLASQGGEG